MFENCPQVRTLQLSHLGLVHDKVKVKNGGIPGYILFYTPWCPHCRAQEKSWCSMARSCPMSTTWYVADVSQEEMSSLADYLEIRGVPTVYQITRDGSLKEYHGSLTSQSLFRNLQKGGGCPCSRKLQKGGGSSRCSARSQMGRRCQRMTSNSSGRCFQHE